MKNLSYPRVTFKIANDKATEKFGGRAIYSGTIQDSLPDIVNRGLIAQFKDRALHIKFFGYPGALRELELAEMVKI